MSWCFMIWCLVIVPHCTVTYETSTPSDIRKVLHTPWDIDIQDTEITRYKTSWTPWSIVRHHMTILETIRRYGVPHTWSLNALWCPMTLHGLSICNTLCIKQCSYIRVTTVVSSSLFSPGIWKCPLSTMLMASCKHAWLYTHAKLCIPSFNTH